MQRTRPVWEHCGLSSAAMRERTEADLRDLPVTDLLAEAEAADITLAAEGDHLRLRGPKKVESLGRLLLDRKAEVLAALVPAHQQTAEESAACSPPVAADSSPWDAESAAAIVAEVDAQIEAALLTDPMADKPARRQVLANERQIVRQLARCREPFLWQWPKALRRLLRRWEEQDAKRDP